MHNFGIHLYKNDFKLKARPSSIRNWYWLSCKPSTSISLAKSPVGVLRARNAVKFFPMICSMQEEKKLLLTSYVQWPASNGSSMKCCVLHSRSSSSQRQIYYKVYVQWASQILSPRESTHKNASAPSYASHRLSPTSPRKTRSKKKLRSCKTSKSRLLLRRTPHSTFRCGMRMGPMRPFLCMQWR